MLSILFAGTNSFWLGLGPFLVESNTGLRLGWQFLLALLWVGWGSLADPFQLG